MTRYFIHWDWFHDIRTIYQLTKETPQMVYGIPYPDGGEERRFWKSKVQFVKAKAS